LIGVHNPSRRYDTAHVVALEEERAALDHRESGHRAAVAALEARVAVLEKAATTTVTKPSTKHAWSQKQSNNK
jgi:hypothetical protein